MNLLPMAFKITSIAMIICGILSIAFNYWILTWEKVVGEIKEFKILRLHTSSVNSIQRFQLIIIYKYKFGQEIYESGKLIPTGMLISPDEKKLIALSEKAISPDKKNITLYVNKLLPGYSIVFPEVQPKWVPIFFIVLGLFLLFLIS